MADRNALDADPRAFIREIDALGVYRPSGRESDSVAYGERVPAWDEFMANLGMILSSHMGSSGTDEEILGRVNPPYRVKEIMEAMRNRAIVPHDPMLPGPRNALAGDQR